MVSSNILTTAARPFRAVQNYGVRPLKVRVHPNQALIAHPKMLSHGAHSQRIALKPWDFLFFFAHPHFIGFTFVKAGTELAKVSDDMDKPAAVIAYLNL